MKKEIIKTTCLEEVTDKYIGKRGTPKREAFEKEFRLDLLEKQSSGSGKNNKKSIK